MGIESRGEPPLPQEPRVQEPLPQGELRAQEPLGQGVHPRQRSVPGEDDDPGLLPAEEGPNQVAWIRLTGSSSAEDLGERLTRAARMLGWEDLSDFLLSHSLRVLFPALDAEVGERLEPGRYLGPSILWRVDTMEKLNLPWHASAHNTDAAEDYRATIRQLREKWISQGLL
jgi:hypothetical protein